MAARTADAAHGVSLVAGAIPRRNPRRGRVIVIPDHAIPLRRPVESVSGVAAAASAPQQGTAAAGATEPDRIGSLMSATSRVFAGFGRPDDGTPQTSPAAPNQAPAAPATAVASAPAAAAPRFGYAATGNPFGNYSATRGSLKDALDALRADRYQEVLRRRNGLRDSLDKTIVDYFLIRSGNAVVTPAMVADFQKRAPNFASPKFMAAAMEAALSRTNADAATVRKVLGNRASTPVGTRLLARAALANGDKRRAQQLVRQAWHTEVMGTGVQKGFISDFSSMMTAEDHLTRIDFLAGEEKFSEARALRPRLGGGSRAYADAIIAVASGDGKASRLMKAVPSGLRKREGYRWAELVQARRAENFDRAARLIDRAPRNVALGDAWWKEARITGRSLAERGKLRAARKAVSRDFAASQHDRVDRAFHRGWFALRAKDARGADRHFAAIEQISSRPLHRARGYYYRGLAAKAAGNGGQAKTHFRAAAGYGFIYHGQLARAELGMNGTGVKRSPSITAADRAAIRKHPAAAAITRLQQAGHSRRNWPLLRHLGDSVPTAGQAALVAELAEKAGQPHFALMVARRAQRRGLPIERVAYPSTAIPRSARVPNGVERALMYAIARQESSFHVQAVSPAGARGLMQVMPKTAQSIARELGTRTSKKKLTSDPAHNATLGAAYLQKRLNNFNGSYVLTAVAYNAGVGRARQWIERFGDPRRPGVDVVEWVEQIPFPETRNYVMRVLANLQVYREALGSGRMAIRQDLARGTRG